VELVRDEPEMASVEVTAPAARLEVEDEPASSARLPIEPLALETLADKPDSASATVTTPLADD
jgi:hypothetical protein